MSEVYEKIKATVVELLDVDEERVTMDANFRDDLEADSLDLVELIMAFEDLFGGRIPDEDVRKITTVREAVDYIESRMAVGK